MSIQEQPKWLEPRAYTDSKPANTCYTCKHLIMCHKCVTFKFKCLKGFKIPKASLIPRANDCSQFKRKLLKPETLRKILALKKKWDIEDGISQEPPKPPTEEHVRELIELFGKKK